MSWDDRHAQERVAKLESLLETLESLAPSVIQAKAMEAVEALIALYGAGLERIMARVGCSTDPDLAEALARDELVAHLLLVHDLHPIDVEGRVRGALAPFRDTVELLGVQDGVARLRLHSGCASSVSAIEEAVRHAAPELDRVTVERAASQSPGLIPPDALLRKPGRGEVRREALPLWAAVEELPSAGSGRAVVKQVLGEPVLFCSTEGGMFACHPSCPGCAGSLDQAVLTGFELVCAACGQRYDVRGGDGNAPAPRLEPVPLLASASGVRVAVGAPGS